MTPLTRTIEVSPNDIIAEFQKLKERGYKWESVTCPTPKQPNYILRVWRFRLPEERDETFLPLMNHVQE